MKITPRHQCHPCRLLLRTWHVAPDAPKGTWSATDGILYAVCRKLCFQLRLTSIKHETNPVCKTVPLQVRYGARVDFLFLFLTTKCNFDFYFPSSRHHMKPVALAAGDVPPHWHKSEPNEAICMLVLSSVRFTAESIDTIASPVAWRNS